MPLTRRLPFIAAVTVSESLEDGQQPYQTIRLVCGL